MNVRALIPAALAAAALAGCSDPYADPTATTSPTRTTSPTTAPTLRAYSRAEINSQDQTTGQQRRREQDAMEQRPLLDRLPVTVGDVTIAIGGLAADNQTTLIAIDPGDGTDEEALAIYRDLLYAHGDNGHAYQPQVTR